MFFPFFTPEESLKDLISFFSFILKILNLIEIVSKNNQFYL